MEALSSSISKLVENTLLLNLLRRRWPSMNVTVKIFFNYFFSLFSIYLFPFYYISLLFFHLDTRPERKATWKSSGFNNHKRTFSVCLVVFFKHGSFFHCSYGWFLITLYHMIYQIDDDALHGVDYFGFGCLDIARFIICTWLFYYLMSSSSEIIFLTLEKSAEQAQLLSLLQFK